MSWQKRKIVNSGPPLNDFIPSCPHIWQTFGKWKYCKPLKNGPNLEKESDWLIKEKRNNWYNFKGALKKQNSSKPASAPLLIGHGS